MESSDYRQERVSCVVFALYLILLCWLILFKLRVRAEDIPEIRSLNLIPFFYDSKSSIHFREVLYNVVVFIPAGFYFSAFFSKKNILYAPAAAALLSLSFEILQWIYSIGASDITDLITNTVGGYCGMQLFILLGRIAGKHRMKIVNTLGIIIELAGLFLITMVTAANWD